MQYTKSSNLLDQAIELQTFLEGLFNTPYHEDQSDEEIIQYVRREFVQRYAIKKYTYDPSKSFAHPVDIMGWVYDVAKRFQAGEPLHEEAQYAVWAAHQEGAPPVFYVPALRQWDVSLPKANGARSDFSLADHGLTRSQAYKEAFYCIGCHVREKDSCSKGLPGKNPLGVERHGCPLNQKISEMAMLAQKGHFLAALAVAMIDNPLIAGTGHRICTACVDSCIFQKQDGVQIPSLESYVWQFVAEKPYGFEVYRLLAMWNPLSPNPLPSSPTGYKALVVGLGPAGMMASLGLLREGHDVYAIDGLHIQNLPDTVLKKELLSYLPQAAKQQSARRDGFGGVMAYGITARWDASRLLWLRLLLERHPQFHMKGDVRLGSTFQLERAKEVGFDHISLCLGAGEPNIPSPELMRGSRFAHDFLMSLHLHQRPPKVDFPCVVIGGGLTAIDTATELLVWLRQQYGADALPEAPVKLIYRRDLKESPGWRLNAEEVRLAAAEGVYIIDNLEPLATIQGDDGKVEGVRVRSADGLEKVIQARTVLLATGTKHHSLSEFGLSNPQTLTHESFMIDYDVSVLGDVHPSYAGSVVHAMASAKDALPYIQKHILSRPPQANDALYDFWDGLSATVQLKENIDNSFWFITIHAPECARLFKPGQFFRLCIDGFPPVAITGAVVRDGALGFLMMETPYTQGLINIMEPGVQVGLMGPTGSPTYLPSDQPVQLVGSGFGHGALLPIAQGLKENNCHITYVGHEAGLADLWKNFVIPEHVDETIWFTDTWPTLRNDVYTIVIGPPHFIKQAQKQKLGDQAVACIPSSMQCMMKGICGRCITRIDPDTYVWACAEQDQPLNAWDPNG